MSDIKKISSMSSAVMKRLPEILHRTMADALILGAQISTTKYMTQTGTGKRSSFPSNDIPTNPSTLTWRTGELARALTRKTHAQNIQEVTTEGSTIVGTLGLKELYTHRYGIHEQGGTIPEHTITVTQRMRKFFWARWYESNQSEDKWKFMALTSDVINIPQINMPARPFLAPVTTDEQMKAGTTQLLMNRVPQQLQSTMRAMLQ